MAAASVAGRDAGRVAGELFYVPILTYAFCPSIKRPCEEDGALQELSAAWARQKEEGGDGVGFVSLGEVWRRRGGGGGGDGIFWWVPPPPPLGQRKSQRRPFLSQPPGHIPRAGPS